MKIALVSEHANPLATLGGADAGGQNVHVAELASRLVARGHRVTVYSRRDSVSVDTRVTTPSGYVVEHVPAGPPTEVPKDELLPYMHAFGQCLRERWRLDPVDLVHAHFWMSGLAAVDATRGTHVPVVQTFHALGAVKQREQGQADTSPAGRVDVERWLCREVDHVLATCTDELRELRALGLPDGRATVVPCGVDVTHFHPSARSRRAARHDGAPRVLVVGRLVERKGIGNVIEALHELPGVELRVAGGPSPDALDADPEVQRLRALARRLGVADRVSFLGSVDHRDMPRTIAECDVVVAAPWYEPFGIVPLEAMACGRPLVGTAVGGLLDTVVPGETGELVPPRRPDALAAALRRLLGDPATRAAYGARGRARAVDLYDWESVAARTEIVYRALAPTGELTGGELTGDLTATRGAVAGGWPR